MNDVDKGYKCLLKLNKPIVNVLKLRFFYRESNLLKSPLERDEHPRDFSDKGKIGGFPDVVGVDELPVPCQTKVTS